MQGTRPEQGAFRMYPYPMTPYQAMNPYSQQQPAQLFQPAPQLPPQSVVQVSGIDSARQLRLPPNSSMFALDYDDRHVYAVFTDGAGVVTAKPYVLTPCDEERPASGFVTVQQFDEFKEAVNGRLSELGPAHPAQPRPDAQADRADRPE